MVYGLHYFVWFFVQTEGVIADRCDNTLSLSVLLQIEEGIQKLFATICIKLLHDA